MFIFNYQGQISCLPLHFHNGQQYLAPNGHETKSEMTKQGVPRTQAYKEEHIIDTYYRNIITKESH